MSFTLNFQVSLKANTTIKEPVYFFGFNWVLKIREEPGDYLPLANSRPFIWNANFGRFQDCCDVEKVWRKLGAVQTSFDGPCASHARPWSWECPSLSALQGSGLLRHPGSGTCPSSREVRLVIFVYFISSQVQEVNLRCSTWNYWKSDFLIQICSGGSFVHFCFRVKSAYCMCFLNA